MDKINGNDPMHPTEEIEIDGEIGNLKGGLTKREYFAALMLQGLVTISAHQQSHETYAKQAISYADALISELNK